MKFYSEIKLSDKRHLTPEGYLVCEDVPIGRVGEMLYAPEEVPNIRGAGSSVVLYREQTDLFREETIASFEGKSVVIGHPSDGWVTPSNVSSIEVGIMQNIRKSDDFLLADLLIKRDDAIKLVRDGNPEVSCGYSFELVDEGGGRGRQTNILGNHVAIVPRGRCGPECKIGDHKRMTKKTSWWARAIAHAAKAGDEETVAEMAEAKEEEEPAKDEEPMAEILARLDKLEAAMAAMQVQEKKEEEAILSAADWQAIVSKAEILSPGISAQFPQPGTAKDVCRCKRMALMAADKTVVGNLTAGRALDAEAGEMLSVIFDSAFELMRNHNNAKLQKVGDAGPFGVLNFNPWSKR